jgi:pimeloyl-ACP methyl ester carboxylesterase
MWAELLPALAERGCRAVAMDLPGFGDAEDPGAEPGSAVLETMSALHIARTALVGSSYGGAVALRVALAEPTRIGAMALVSAPAPGMEPSGELQAAWEAEDTALARGDIDGAVAGVLETWLLPDAPPALRDRIREMQRRAFEQQAGSDDDAQVDDALDSDPSLLSTLDIPALIAVGERDKPDFRAGAEAMARDLPRARLSVIPRAGHLAPLEQPRAFRELLLDWLRAA